MLHWRQGQLSVPTCGSVASHCTMWSSTKGARSRWVHRIASSPSMCYLPAVLHCHAHVSLSGGPRHGAARPANLLWVRCVALLEAPANLPAAVCVVRQLQSCRSASLFVVQFRDDVAVNPNDTEESIWAFLCEAQLLGAEAARQQFLQVGSPMLC